MTSFSSRILTFGTIVSALSAASFSAKPIFAEDPGVESWLANEYHELISKAQSARLELDRKDEIVLRRTLLKIEIAQDVVDGKIEFVNAMKRFEELNRIPPATISPAVRTTSRSLEAGYQLASYLRATRTPRAIELAAEWEGRLSVEE